MARSQGADSAGSQFFICLDAKACAHLNGNYAAFGKIVAGMGIVDQIAATPTYGETPLVEQVMREVYFVTAPEGF